MRRKVELREKANPSPGHTRYPALRSPRRWILGIAVVCAVAGAGFLLQRYGAIGPEDNGGHSAVDSDRNADRALPAFVPQDPAFRPIEATSQELIRGTTGDVRRLIEQFPDDPAAVDALARLQYQFGNSAEAIEAWQRCLKLDPDFVSAYEGLGQAAAARDEHEKAAEYFRKALKLNPRSPRTPIDLAHVLMNQGKLDEVIALLAEKEVGSTGGNSAEARPPSLPRSMPRFLLLAQAYQQLKQHEKAKKNFEIAVDMAPEYPSGHYGLAMTCVELGLKEEAKKHLQAFRRLEAADRQGRTRADTQTDDERSVRQTLAQARTGVGRVWARHQRDEEAETQWRRAAALDAEQTACREDLAALYERTGREEESLRVCQELAKIAPANADYALNVGVLSARLSRFAEARAAVERAIQLDPGNARYREVYRMIEKIRE